MEIHKEIDTRGLNCPLPILKAKKALAELDSGQLLKVLARTGRRMALKDLAREAERVASFQQEIDAQLRALGRALAGDVAYWDTPL